MQTGGPPAAFDLRLHGLHRCSRSRSSPERTEGVDQRRFPSGVDVRREVAHFAQRGAQAPDADAQLMHVLGIRAARRDFAGVGKDLRQAACSAPRERSAARSRSSSRHRGSWPWSAARARRLSPAARRAPISTRCRARARSGCASAARVRASIAGCRASVRSPVRTAHARARLRAPRRGRRRVRPARRRFASRAWCARRRCRRAERVRPSPGHARPCARPSRSGRRRACRHAGRCVAGARRARPWAAVRSCVRGAAADRRSAPWRSAPMWPPSLRRRSTMRCAASAPSGGVEIAGAQTRAVGTSPAPPPPRPPPAAQDRSGT